MNVKVRLILLVVVCFLVLMAGVLGLRLNENGFLGALYQDQQKQFDQSTLGILNLNRKLLEQVLIHYSRSDEMFRFAATGQSTPAQASLQAEVDNKSISVAWVYDQQDQRLLLAADPGLSLAGNELVIASDVLNAIRAAEAHLHFFIQAENGDILEMYGAAIRPRLASLTAPPVSGVLVVGQRWDGPYLARLTELLGGELSIVPLMQVSQPASRLGSIPHRVILQYPLLQWSGAPLPVMLQADFELPFVEAILDMLNRNTLLTILLAFFFLAVTSVALYHWVYLPLEEISTGLEKGQPGSLARLTQSRTEFGNIARLILRSFQFQAEMDAEIAQRRVVEGALRNSEATYRALVDFSIQGFAIFQNGRIVFSNPALAEGLGYTQEALISEAIGPVTGLFHPDDEASICQYLEDCLAGPQPEQRKKVRMLRPDGAVVWMEVLANPVEYQDAPAVQAAFLDVTKRELAEQALRGEQEFALAILNTVNSIIVVMDREGRLVRCNPACAQVVGLNLDEIPGKLFGELFWTAGGIAIGVEEVRKLINEQTVLTRESLFFVHNGPPRSIAWSNGFIFDERGQVKYMVGTGVDVTERRQRERQQAVIASLASDLRGMLPRAAILEVITARTAQFLQCDVAAVALYRPATRDLVIESTTGEMARGLVGSLMQEGQGIGGQVLRTREPVMNNSLREEPGLLLPALREKICAGAWVPLVAEGSTLGLIFAGSQRSIEPNDFQLLVSIADIGASAVQRCLLADEMQQQLQRLTSLHTINMAISASLDVRVTLQLLVSQITSQLGVSATDVLLIDPVTRDLKFAAGHGFHSREVEKSRYWLGEGKAGQVALYRRAMQLYDPDGIASQFPQAVWMGGEEFIAYEAVPLTNKGEIEGVLETFHRAPYLPEPEWLRFLESLAMQISIAINNAELLDRLQRSNLELGLAYDATIEGWARALELRDEETEGHTKRVTEWTVRLAQGMGISGEELIQIRRGALLHDIGKMGIPDSILRKKGPLDEAEWAIMREHPSMAFDMMASINFLRPAMAIPFSHHERWNGSGYPQKLAGRQIPLAARIFAVVDVWDALFYGRLYRLPMPEAEVLDYLRREAGNLFDSEVVNAFVEMRAVMEKRG